MKFLEFLAAGVGQHRKAETPRSEMRKLEAPTKRRSLPLPEEAKFPEFLGVEAGQHRKAQTPFSKMRNLEGSDKEMFFACFGGGKVT